MNRICPTILAAVALSGCGGPNYTLSGRAGLAPGDTLRLCSPYENDSVLATTVIRRDSSFRIRGHVSEPTIANLMHNDRRIGAPILLEAADIRLEPTGDVRGFQFTGTPLNDAFNAMNAAQVSLGNVLQALENEPDTPERRRKLDSLGRIYRQIPGDALEANRDNLVIYITTRISRAGTLPLEAERDAGKFLYKVIKPYIGIARLPVAQETAKIQGLLIDLRKGENATYVTTLGLEAYLAELEKENNAYIALTSARTQSRAANKKDNSATIRQRLDSQYDDLVMLAQSFSVAQPSAAATTFVSNLNQLISETVTAFNQRKKGSGPAGEGGGGSSDRPEIE